MPRRSRSDGTTSRNKSRRDGCSKACREGSRKIGCWQRASCRWQRSSWQSFCASPCLASYARVGDSRGVLAHALGFCGSPIEGGGHLALPATAVAPPALPPAGLEMLGGGPAAASGLMAGGFGAVAVRFPAAKARAAVRCRVKAVGRNTKCPAGGGQWACYEMSWKRSPSVDPGIRFCVPWISIQRWWTEELLRCLGRC